MSIRLMVPRRAIPFVWAVFLSTFYGLLPFGFRIPRGITVGKPAVPHGLTPLV
jgi:hypothetical protein